MICEICKNKPATIFHKLIINGVETSQNICEDCARSFNGSLKNDFHNVNIILKNAFGSLINNRPNYQVVACPRCGLTQIELQNGGRFGCLECYETFEAIVENVIAKTQQGRLHVGKIPKTIENEANINDDIGEINVQIQKAIGAEDYELKHQLGDIMKELKNKGTGDNHGKTT